MRKSGLLFVAMFISTKTIIACSSLSSSSDSSTGGSGGSGGSSNEGSEEECIDEGCESGSEKCEGNSRMFCVSSNLDPDCYFWEERESCGDKKCGALETMPDDSSSQSLCCESDCDSIGKLKCSENDYYSSIMECKADDYGCLFWKTKEKCYSEDVNIVDLKCIEREDQDFRCENPNTICTKEEENVIRCYYGSASLSTRAICRDQTWVPESNLDCPENQYCIEGYPDDYCG